MTLDAANDTKRAGNTPLGVGDPVKVSWKVPLLTLLLVVLVLRDVSTGTVGVGISDRRAQAAAVVASVGGPLWVLRGRVEGNEHVPIVGATVEAILMLDEHAYSLGEAVSRADGSFVMERLPAGSYWLVARAPGRARCIRTVRIDKGDPPPVVFTLGPGATIAGTVFRSRGRSGDTSPLVGVVVRAVSEGVHEGPPHAVRTGADGAFVLEGLAPGTYRVEVTAPGYEPMVRGAVPAPARGLRFVLRELASVQGVVRDGHGAPAHGAEVVLVGSGIWPPRSVSVRSDGRFEILGIPAGVYELRARRESEVAEPVAPLVLEPGDVRTATLTVTAGAVLTGTVIDAASGRPVPGARVIVAEDAVATSPLALVADASGVFRATGLLRRPHEVSARAEGYVSRLGTIVTPGTGPVTIALDREVVLTGRVVDTQGTPVPGAQIEVWAQDLDGRTTWLSASAMAFRDALFTAQSRGPRPLIPAGELGVMPGPVPVIPLDRPSGAGAWAQNALQGYVTDAQGRFRVTEVPPGVVTVVASHPAYVRGESARRVVRAGEAVDMEIVLHPGGTLDGRVVDERGFPVPGQWIEVRAERDPWPRRVFSLRDGTFRVPSVLGRVSVVALVSGRVGGRTEVEVTDHSVVPVTLVLDRNVRRVRGRVVDARGFPVAGAELVFTPSVRGASSTQVVSATDGTFDAVVGGRGGMVVQVRHPGFVPRTVRIDERENDVTIALDTGGSLAFDVWNDGCAVGEISLEVRTPCGPVRRVLRNGGRVSIDHLCPGRVTVMASAGGCVPGEVTGTVVAQRRVEFPRVELSAGGAVEGEVVDREGQPVPGAVITLADAPAITGTARSDRQGRFVAGDLPDGDRRIVAVHPVLGRSRTATVRILRGTMARGVVLAFDRALQGATGAETPAPVMFVDRGGWIEVEAVVPESAPARAGLQPGDRLLTVQGIEVRTAAEALRRLEGPVGDEVVVEVSRDGVRRTVRWVHEPWR